MKVKLSKVIEGIEFQGLESSSYLNLETGEIFLIADEEVHAVEDIEDISDRPDWYKEAIAVANEFLENRDKYLDLPSKYDLHEYRIMEDFVYSIPIKEQKEEMLRLIKGKGAFSRFKHGLERFLLRDKWYEYRDTEIAKFVEEWCQDNNIPYENDSQN